MRSVAAYVKAKRRTPFRAAAVCALGVALLFDSQPAATAQGRQDPEIPRAFANSMYRSALRRFPGLGACRKAGFLKDDIPFFDLHEVFRTSEEVEVCHYWLFRSVDDPKAAAIAYFRGVDGLRTDVLSIASLNNPRTSVQGRWSPPESGVPFGGTLSRWWIGKVFYGASLSVSIDKNNEVTDVSLDLTSE